ncbi:F-box/LRR-repeat protein 6 [Sarcoptes scabiei]|nr:F-box/LRR-repeat protein 6 [Sarcoptes scabiei]
MEGKKKINKYNENANDDLQFDLSSFENQIASEEKSANIHQSSNLPMIEKKSDLMDYLASNDYGKKRARKSKKRPRLKTTDSSDKIKMKKTMKIAHEKVNQTNRKKTKNQLNSSQNGFSNNLSFILKPSEIDFPQVLPTELLVRIFSFLIESSENSLEILIRVCECWRKIILKTPKLWSQLNLSLMANSRYLMEQLKNLHSASKIFQFVNEINLTDWKGEMVLKFLHFFKECSENEIHSLNLKNVTNAPTDFFKSLVNSTGSLRYLNISGITVKSHHNRQNIFSNTAFKSLMERNGSTLHSLNMAENITNSFGICFASVMEYCPNLQVLDISNVTSLGTPCSSISIEKFQQSCPNIRILRAANVCFQTTCSSSAIGWTKLEELSIPFNVSFVMSAGHNDHIIERLTKSSENLTLLDIRGSANITPRGLVKIPAWSLKHLYISNCPKMQDDTLGMVFAKWKNSLVDIDLSWNKSESSIDECVQSFCDAPKHEINLKRIDFRGSAISLETLRRLIVHCGDRIVKIDLQSCRSLPRGMKRLFQGEDFLHLRQQFYDLT